MPSTASSASNARTTSLRTFDAAVTPGTAASAVPAARGNAGTDALAPGEYRQEALTAAREALAQAATGQLAGRDVGPLFSVLQTYGDATVVADLEKALPQWGFYSTMALAGLPDGAGIPALIRSAQDPELAGTGRDNFRFQILAQIAPQYPEVASALIDAPLSTCCGPKSGRNSGEPGHARKRFLFWKNV